MRRFIVRAVGTQTVRSVASVPLRSAMRWGVVGAVGTVAMVGAGMAVADTIPRWGVPGTAKERTFIAIKPDGVQRRLVADVIERFERKGYKLVGLKMIQPTEEFAAKHYSDLSKKPFFPSLVKYFASGPVVAMVWEGHDAIKTGRKIVGATNPTDAEMGSVRGDYCIQIGRNVIHGSDGPESAKDEIGLWFTDAEVVNYNSVDYNWIHEK